VLDPITIAAAYKACTTAIDLAKRGVELYKQIKSTSGDVSDVLKDLKEQYNKIVSPSRVTSLTSMRRLQRSMCRARQQRKRFIRVICR